MCFPALPKVSMFTVYSQNLSTTKESIFMKFGVEKSNDIYSWAGLFIKKNDDLCFQKDGLLRLALNEVLRCKEGSLFVLAPCCKSFTPMYLGGLDLLGSV